MKVAQVISEQVPGPIRIDTPVRTNDRVVRGNRFRVGRYTTVVYDGNLSNDQHTTERDGYEHGCTQLHIRLAPGTL